MSARVCACVHLMGWHMGKADRFTVGLVWADMQEKMLLPGSVKQINESLPVVSSVQLNLKKRK